MLVTDKADHSLGVIVHPIQFGASPTHYPDNFFSIHQKRLSFFFKEVEFEVGQEIAEQFTFATHAERGEGVTFLGTAEIIEN